MKTSAHGVKLIEAREGVRLKVYRDSKGLPTVGVGHLVLPEDGLKVRDVITQAQCDAFLAKDLKECEHAVNAVEVPLKQWQFDALVSFIFNIGVGGFLGSTVRKKLKLKDYDGAAKAMLSWKKPPEIIGRRQTEYNQFLHPDHYYASRQLDADTSAAEPTPTAPAPIKPVDGSPSPDLTSTGDVAGAQDKPPIYKRLWTRFKVWQGKADEATTEISGIQTSVGNVKSVASPVSKSSWTTVLATKVWGFLLMLWGALGDHPLYAILGTILIFAALWYLTRSKDRGANAMQQPVQQQKVVVNTTEAAA